MRAIVRTEAAPVTPPSKVLVVDDDALLLRALVRLLVLDGHAVTGAVSVAAARKLAATLLPDVVVLDVGLDDGEGLELAPTLVASGTRVIFFSGTVVPSVVASASQLGPFVPKGRGTDALLDAVRVATSRRE